MQLVNRFPEANVECKFGKMYPISKLNVHFRQFEKKIARICASEKWSRQLINSPDEFCACFSNNVFTNLIHDTFTRVYMKKHPCCECGAQSEQRCHGVGEERPKLLQRVLDRQVYPVKWKKVLCEFLHEHIYTGFCLKCRQCHLKEGQVRKGSVFDFPGTK